MSRSGYSDDLDNWTMIRWRGAVASSIRGKRGQAFLRELIDALDAIPGKRLIAHELRKDGAVCALGSVGAKRGINLEVLDPYDSDTLAATFGVARPLICELEYENDNGGWYRHDTDENRWKRIRDWAENNLQSSAKQSSDAVPGMNT